ncbi:peptide-methionine (R)-S-oxide reductase [Flavobacterium sufflavum]|uniref:peptide-methionine (R)-S-oxide reductase n=1 Tax=Flavobacterium sufflavum TaxID=1921138 RepID=A0A437KV09_9FLAO|nr:peptide-methionine (R)-S-oxide reductase MsrB [Flavobacterium sufflavum]RVT75912.1 peptide-methionine (R)-S-oxide reductase [Flavobacterium sufflavum]
MKTNSFINLLFLLPLFIITACGQNKQYKEIEKITSDNKINKPGNPYYSNTDTTKLNLSDAEWKKVLPEDVYLVMRKAETETAFTGKYWNTDEKGTYYCAACGNLLFRSTAKFSSSCGWPSFFEQDNKKSVVYRNDFSYNMERIEALCGRCGGHLGHLFDDGPPPTGKRYCMNSIALDFIPDNKQSQNNSTQK